MKIAMFASESNPLAKTGGLADVVYALSKALAANKANNVIIALPFYKSMLNKGLNMKNLGSFKVYMSWREQEAKVSEVSFGDVDFYLIGNDYYFGRDKLFGYEDDGERFAFFALACRKLLKFLNFQADIVHVHDWETAMIPCLIKEGCSTDPFYAGMKFVLTIHNPAFKGMIARYFLGDFYNLSDQLYDEGKVRFQGMVSTLKSGIYYADKITTVSPTHRLELLTNEGGQGLNGILELRKDDFIGILNGIDVEEWDPATDTAIAKNFGLANLEEGKHLNQADLLASFHIKWYGGPVYGLVSRLSWQKGIDLVLASGRKALAQGADLVILGNGEYELEQKCEALRRSFPDTCGLYIGYNSDLGHKIYAGSDFFLMPSLFEPCGTSQMIAQRYGTPPIVRYTGGLRDTVRGYDGTNADSADGIGFNDYNETGLDYGLSLAKELYGKQGDYYKIARNAMRLDRSWKRSAAEYERLYKSLAKPKKS
jgi:starch synthase